MEESKKLKLQAVVSKIAAERDSAHSSILSILEMPHNPDFDYVSELDKQFSKLAEAENKIDSISLLFSRLESIDKNKELVKRKNESNGNLT